IVIPIDYEESDVVGFILTAVTPLTIYGGYYSAEIEQINDVNIAICSTTFKKEKYIKHNVNLLKEKIYETDNELAEHLYMVVVDNGSSLSENEINGEKIKLVPNANVGGAGGFTRGMLEVIDLAEKKEYLATHVLFMDDDVEINTESLNRTYSLLKFLKSEYKDRFISGAMLNLSQHNIQFENIGFIDEGLASWRSLKPQFDLCLYDHVLFNELEYTVNNMYGAWWFCAVPIKFINKENLSLPIFYRTDDIEFSLRNKAEFITLNGIGIWHMPFWDKENEALDYYLSIRNPLVIQATSGVFPKAEFIKRIERDFRGEIRKFNYTACEHLLDALDDFMKGPGFLQSLNGEQKLKSQCTKNQQLIPVSNFGFTDEQMNTAYDYVPLSEQDMQLFEETDNGHTLSDTILDDKNLPFIAQMFFQSPGKQFLKKHIILTSVPKKSIAILTIDRKKYAELIKRHDELFNYYNENKENIINSYRNQAKNMMSADFWWGYLEGMKK
ncbi:MAG: hypothetical protein LBM93_06155, partial [Oscillospiraceae bacterium]|nr:hypothetical protein [Oscillospiraceae bacterium]